MTSNVSNSASKTQYTNVLPIYNDPAKWKEMYWTCPFLVRNFRQVTYIGLTFIWPCVVIYFYSKTNQMHQYLKFILLELQSTCFGRCFRPSSGVKNCTYSNRHMSNRYCYCLLASRQQYLFDICMLLYVQSLNPDDGRKDRPKHVDCYSNKINIRY